MPTTLLAPAKVNLSLRVAARDADSGLHPISSWMTTIDLCDEVSVAACRTEEQRLEISGPSDWPREKDLAWRAVRALEQYLGRGCPVVIRLTKRIPTGAGLGGGSSCAAASLRACNLELGLGIPDEQMSRIAATIGSDVPFFLRGGAGVVSGFGERFEPVVSPAGALVLLVPPVHCATGAVYDAFDQQEARSIDHEGLVKLATGGVPEPNQLVNDLRDAAEDLHPALRELRRSVEQLIGFRVHMTGSGSASFILSEDPDPIVAVLKRAHPDVTCIPARFLSIPH